MRKSVEAWIVFIVMIALLVFCFSACKVVKEVPVETIKTEIKYIDHIQYDSIYKRDSIYIQAIGDTICIYKDKYIYKYQQIHDTTFVCKIDSIPYTIEVEKQLSKYEELQMSVGRVGIPLIVILICCAIGYVVKKFI